MMSRTKRAAQPINRQMKRNSMAISGPENFVCVRERESERERVCTRTDAAGARTCSKISYMVYV